LKQIQGFTTNTLGADLATFSVKGETVELTSDPWWFFNSQVCLGIAPETNKIAICSRSNVLVGIQLHCFQK